MNRDLIHQNLQWVLKECDELEFEFYSLGFDEQSQSLTHIRTAIANVAQEMIVEKLNGTAVLDS